MKTIEGGVGEDGVGGNEEGVGRDIRMDGNGRKRGSGLDFGRSGGADFG